MSKKHCILQPLRSATSSLQAKQYCILQCFSAFTKIVHLKSIVFYSLFATSAKSDGSVMSWLQAKKYCILQCFSASAKIVHLKLSNGMSKKILYFTAFLQLPQNPTGLNSPTLKHERPYRHQVSICQT